MSHEAVSSIEVNSTRWTGEWNVSSTGQWIDYALLLVGSFSNPIVFLVLSKNPKIFFSESIQSKNMNYFWATVRD